MKYFKILSEGSKSVRLDNILKQILIMIIFRHVTCLHAFMFKKGFIFLLSVMGPLDWNIGILVYADHLHGQTPILYNTLQEVENAKKTQPHFYISRSCPTLLWNEHVMNSKPSFHSVFSVADNTFDTVYLHAHTHLFSSTLTVSPTVICFSPPAEECHRTRWHSG